MFLACLSDCSISLMALRIHMFSNAACGVPEGYSAQYINGFVEELVVNDDPEYQWIDKIRTPRHRVKFLKTFEFGAQRGEG